MRLDEPSAGTWTRTAPTSPGWYWFWGWEGGPGPPRLHAWEVFAVHGVGLRCEVEGWEREMDDFGRGWWHPLAPPSVEGLEP